MYSHRIYAALILAACTPETDNMPAETEPVSEPDAETASAEVTTIAGPFEASGGVAVDDHGWIYVADFGAFLNRAGGRNVYRIPARGGRPSVFADGFAGASGNSFGADGMLYQSDVARGEAYSIDGAGVRTRIADGLRAPVGIVRAPGGAIYVAECGASAISRISASGTVSRIAEGAPLNCPNGLTVGGDGALYTVNFNDGAMMRVAADGEISTFAAIPGGGNGHLAYANGRFYVASFRGGRLYEVSEDGDVSVLTGSEERGNEDGTLSEATFFKPNGVAISPDGRTLYVNTTFRAEPYEATELHPNLLRAVSLPQ